MKGPERLDPAADRRRIGLEYASHLIVRSGYGESDLAIGSTLQYIEVPEDQGGFSLNSERPAVLCEDGEASPGEPVFFFQGLIGIAHPADPDPPLFLLLYFFRQQFGSVHLYVDEYLPRFAVP